MSITKIKSDRLDISSLVPKSDFAEIGRHGVTSRDETTISFDGVNTFTITPTISEWSYYRDGLKYMVTGTKSVVIPGTPIANNYSNTIACDLILTMATNWRGVQTALRAQRLLSKANTKNALTTEELNSIEAGWNEFLTYIKQQITA